ncbi:SAV_2336 N-terminal domain-related protein [Kitasatospora sp. NPDC001540]|uniref:SAV_2336 N-terminal domain-related protein n=1 Tax=Kitasatospora sp. NPDC001540 TaxID=3364014 RepID=UPI0036AACB21
MTTAPGPDPERDAVRRLAALLADLTEDPAPTGRELAELLWLHALLDGPTGPGPDGPSFPRATGGAEASARPPRTPARPRPIPERTPPPARDRPLHLPDPNPGPHPAPASGPDPDHPTGQDAPPPHTPPPPPPLPAAPIRVGTARVLPRRRELTRALRPLKRRVPSVDRTVLDEEATAELLSRDPRWWPVLAPALDRWLGLRLVVDARGDSAALWEPLARELFALLAGSGLFRDVRLHHLTGPDLPDEDTGPGTARPGRTATFVLTDGVHPDWAGPRLRAALRRRALAGPTAVLHTLPEHLWSQTALAPEPGRFRTAAPADPHPRFTPYALAPPPQPPGTLAVPVLGLTPEWLAPWARAVAGPHAYDAPAVLLGPDRRPGRRPGPSEVRRLALPTGDLDSFLAQAQPRVFRLAALLATVPLNFGVMRLVQSAMLPESPPADLAEIVFSGILYVVPGRSATEPLDRAYEFAPGVRERLLATLRRDEAEQVVATVSAHLATHRPGVNSRFTAAVPDPDGPLALPADARPWARTTVPVRAGSTTAGRRFFLPVVGAAVPGGSEPGAVALVAQATLLAQAFRQLGYQVAELNGQQPTLQVLRDWAGDVRLGPDDLVVVHLTGHSVAAFGQQAELLLPEGLFETGHGRRVRSASLQEFRLALGRPGRLLLIIDQYPLRAEPPSSPPGHPQLTLLVRRGPSSEDFVEALAARITAIAAGAVPPVTKADLLNSLALPSERSLPADVAETVLPFFAPDPLSSVPPFLLDELMTWIAHDHGGGTVREVLQSPQLRLTTLLRCLQRLVAGLRPVVLDARGLDSDRLWGRLDAQLGSRRSGTVLEHLVEHRHRLLLVVVTPAPLRSFLRTVATAGVRVLLVGASGASHDRPARLRPDRNEAQILEAAEEGASFEETDRSRAADAYRLVLDLALAGGSHWWPLVATTALDRLGAPRSTPYPTQLDRIQAALTTVPGAADALLDLSALIHSGPPDFVGQVHATLRALIDHRGEPATGVHAVVDPASLDALDRRDRAAVRSWIDNELVETSDAPEERLTELATLLDLPLISPLPTGVPLPPWVSRLEPRPGPGRVVRLVAHPASGRPALPAESLDRLTRHRWRCPTTGCSRYRTRLAPPPLPSVNAEGSAVCTAHRTLLDPVGPRPLLAHLKAVTLQFCSAQFTVEEQSSFPLSLSPDSVPLVVSFQDGAVTVRATDIGARHRPAATAPWQDLVPERPLPFPPGARVATTPYTTLVRTGTPLPGEAPLPAPGL